MRKVVWGQGYELQLVPSAVFVVFAFRVQEESPDGYPVTGTRHAILVHLRQIDVAHVQERHGGAPSARKGLFNHMRRADGGEACHGEVQRSRGTVVMLGHQSVLVQYVYTPG